MAGSIRMRLAGVALLALASAFLTACGGAGTGGQSNTDLLKAAIANMQALKSYHIEGNMTSSGQVVTVSGDIDQAAKNLKLSINTGGQTLDVVGIGTDVYTSSDGGATYQRSDASQLSDLTALYDIWSEITPADIDQAGDSLKDGDPPTDTIDGVVTKHITGRLNFDTSGGGVSGGGNLEVWVTTDALPTVRQQTNSGNVDGSKSTFSWSKINAPVDITVPSNVTQ